MAQSEKHRDPLQQAKVKAARFCAYRERTQQEVRDKLYQYGLHQEQVEELISDLITEGFINEERFAIAYASGKFRLKKWGKLKIQRGLEQHGLTTYCISKGLEAVEEDDYQATLKRLTDLKWERLQESDIFIKKHKTANYLIGKGFEPEIVWTVLGDY
jgi:regulatory protein